jgi:serine O-acetyltransferase
MLENVRRDLLRACRGNQNQEGAFALLRELFNPGTQAILVHRFGYWCDHVRIPGVRHALRIIHFALDYMFAWRVGIFIPIKAEIGPGMMIHTWGGGVFIPQCRIGRDLTIVGGGVLFDHDTLEIGDNVVVGAGTKSVGRIRIGSRVRTGPNSVIQEPVPDDSLVFGNPGRIIRRFPTPKPAAAAAPAAPVAPVPRPEPVHT